MNFGFLVLIGVPGSGKTTLAKTLINQCNKFNKWDFYFIHICFDELINFSCEGSSMAWKSARNSTISDVEKFAVALKNGDEKSYASPFSNQLNDVNSFKSKIILIIDDNMYFKSMRYTFYQIARRHDIGFCQVYLNCSLNLAITRNKQREKRSIVPCNIIENMFSKIEPPNKNNGWEKYSVEINDFYDINTLYNSLFPILNESMENSHHTTLLDKQERERSVTQCQKNILHQTDITLRKIINKKMKELILEHSKCEIKSLTVQFTTRKSEIMQDIKLGKICLTNEILYEIEQNSEDKCLLSEFLCRYF